MKRVKIELEYLFKATPGTLYYFIVNPSNLVRWFCDSVDLQEDVYTFEWDGYPEEAELIDDIEDERLRFRWLEADGEEYFEFRMFKSGMTQETVLEITDFCDADEKDEQIDIWNKQIERLKSSCGG